MTSRSDKPGPPLECPSPSPTLKSPAAHIPVLLSEVIEALAPAGGETIVDATFGAGGYSRAILEAAAVNVLALDRDPRAVAGAKVLCDAFPGRLTVVQSPFGELEAVVHDRRGLRSPPSGLTPADPIAAVVLDIGVSSMQLDQAERGFSFMTDGPLDMRMGNDGPSAADVVATVSDAALADIIYHLGEERQARRIARAIVTAREAEPITRTRQLAHIVERAVGRGKGEEKHPATRTFQALRIWVNDELGELVRALVAAERVLIPGGRLVVVTFHSLEDRIVKRFLARRSGRQPGASRHGPPGPQSFLNPSFRIVNQRPLTPSQPEIEANPRARSAKLRAAVRTEAQPVEPEAASELGVPEPRGGWGT